MAHNHVLGAKFRSAGQLANLLTTALLLCESNFPYFSKCMKAILCYV